VFWFDPTGWDPNDRRRARAQRWTLASARERFQRQASTLERFGLRIEPVVLDASLPADIQLEEPEYGDGDDAGEVEIVAE
jgi:hypothetical protein